MQKFLIEKDLGHIIEKANEQPSPDTKFIIVQTLLRRKRKGYCILRSCRSELDLYLKKNEH